MPNNNLYVSDPELERRVSQWPDLKTVYTGCKLLAGLDRQGAFHYHSSAYTYYRSAYWYNLAMLAPDLYHTGVLFGLRTDGTCIVSKDPFAGNQSYSREYDSTRMDNNCFSGLLYSIHTVKDAVQIAATGRLFLALDRAGRVHVRRYLWERFYFPDQPDYCRQQIDTIESWRDIRRILLAEPDTVIAQKNSGELVYAGSGQDLFGTFGEASFRQLQDREIVGACSYCGGESYYFVFLDADGILHSRRWQEERRFRQVVGLDHAFLGLTTDGQVVSFQGPLEESAENWPRMKQIAIGRRSFDSYDDLFLAGLRDDEA